MKICFLGDAASIHIRRWCEYFMNSGNQVSIISFTNADIQGVDVYFAGDSMEIDSSGGNVQYLKKIFLIKKLIKQIDPDIVNAHYLTSYGLLGALVKDRPLVVSTWGSDILVTPKRNIVFRKMTQYVLKKCNLITSDSNFMTDEIVQLGVKRDKVITVPMGIEPAIFNLQNVQEKKGNNLILSMRTLNQNSNIDVILKSFGKVLESQPDAKLILTNSGDQEELLKNIVNEMGLQDNVQFMGMVPRDKVAELLKKCRVYLSVPTSDSTSVTLLEAMACGIFPIVSDIPANREWIENGKGGIIIDEIKPDKLSEAIIRAMSDDEMTEKAAALNSSIVNERAIWKKNMTFVENTYGDVIGGKR